ncbi:MAG: AAA family ATPase [Maritimibacter sp.]|nr:AAA family ATPase [Maritimibacter sp.]
MSRMDVHSPIPARMATRPADADRVDVRGLVRAIFGRRALILGMMLLCAVLAYLAARQMAPQYTAYAKVLLAPRQVQVNQADAVVSTAEVSEPEVFSEMSVMRSNVLLAALIEQIGLERLEIMVYGAARPAGQRDNRVASLIDAMREDLRITREAESNVVVIRFDQGDPELVAAVANGLADTYIAQQLARQRESVRQATSWIQDLVAEAQAEVERTEIALAAARSQSLAREGASYENANQQLGTLTSELAVARAGLAAAQATYEQLGAILADQGPQELAKAVTSTMLETLLADRLELVRKDEEWARSYDATHPQRVRLADQIAQIDVQIATEAERIIELRGNDVAVAQSRVSSLAASVQELEDRLAGISGNTVDLRRTELEAAAARQYYETLLARLSSATGQDRLQLPEARVIDRAPVPEAPTAPRPKLLGAFGAMLGLTIGLAIAVILEMTRSTFRTRREIEAATGHRVLATLPRVRGRDMRRIVSDLSGKSNSVFGERVRQLKTFLFARKGGRGAQVIMVASSRPGEGKSLVAMALAEMAVLAGKEVVMVDGDLRASKLVKGFGWKPVHDFADFVLERCALDEAILTDDELGINVLPTANHSIQAADELSIDWLKPMMDELKAVYDVVIIDSPPLLDVADGLVLARVADQIVYVVRWDQTTRQAVNEGLEALAALRLGVAGIVLNRADPKYTDSAYGAAYGAYAS